MTPIHDDTHIGSVTIKARDLENLVHFYTKTIGLKVLVRDQSVVQLTADGKTPLLILEVDAELKQRPVKSAGLYHFALLVPTRKDLANILYHFIKNHTQLTGAANHKFSEAIYLQDPENNGIEVYRDVNRVDWVRDERGKLPAVSEPLDVHGLLKERDTGDWGGLPVQTVMGHVHLNVTSIPEAEQFYVNVLGFEEQTRMENHALFVSAGGYHHHIALNIWNGPNAIKVQNHFTGLLHYDIIVPSKDEISHLRTVLETNHILYECKEETLVLKDPAGNGIIIKTR
jgi:catechol 2,3-dioxygenase